MWETPVSKLHNRLTEGCYASGQENSKRFSCTFLQDAALQYVRSNAPSSSSLPSPVPTSQSWRRGANAYTPSIRFTTKRAMPRLSSGRCWPKGTNVCNLVFIVHHVQNLPIASALVYTWNFCPFGCIGSNRWWCMSQCMCSIKYNSPLSEPCRGRSINLNAVLCALSILIDLCTLCKCVQRVSSTSLPSLLSRLTLVSEKVSYMKRITSVSRYSHKHTVLSKKKKSFPWKLMLTYCTKLLIRN